MDYVIMSYVIMSYVIMSYVINMHYMQYNLIPNIDIAGDCTVRLMPLSIFTYKQNLFLRKRTWAPPEHSG